jgi:hypothetical protein
VSKKKEKMAAEWLGWLHLDGWEGRTKQPVKVVGQTPKRYRIKPEGDIPVRLAGRSRSVRPGETVLVPKYAVTKRVSRAGVSTVNRDTDTPKEAQ